MNTILTAFSIYTVLKIKPNSVEIYRPYIIELLKPMLFHLRHVILTLFGLILRRI